jgi:hypothetical protein
MFDVDYVKERIEESKISFLRKLVTEAYTQWISTQYMS